MAVCKTVLVTRPNHDPTVNYLYFFAGEVIEEAKKKNFHVLDLKGEKATRDNFESYIKSKHPNFIFLNGHGSDEVVVGQNNEPLLICGENKNLTQCTVVYSLSCQTGAKLGPSLVENGKAKAFIGYRRNFTFIRNHDYETKPLRDKLASFFLKPSNLVATTLIKNHSVTDAHERSQRSMRQSLHFMLSSKASYEEKQSAPYLSSNIKYQVVLGNKNAVI